MEISITRQEVERRGAQYRFILLESTDEVPPLLISSQMGIPGNVKLLHLKTLHLADNQPFMYEDRWVNLEAAPSIVDADLTKINANEWLVQNAPFSEGDISFSATNASDIEAKHLAITAGAAIFTIERMTKFDGVSITLVKLAYAPGFRMHTTL